MGYHWWTVRAWWQPNDRGVKLGPLAVCRYRFPEDRTRWYLAIVVLNRWPLTDTGLTVLREAMTADFTKFAHTIHGAPDAD